MAISQKHLVKVFFVFRNFLFPVFKGRIIHPKFSIIGIKFSIIGIKPLTIYGTNIVPSELEAHCIIKKVLIQKKAKFSKKKSPEVAIFLNTFMRAHLHVAYVV